MMHKLASIMIRLRKAMPVLVMTIAVTGPAFAQDFYTARPLRYGNTSSWYFDARNDHRDFPTNGLFPGNFAANPPYATIGAAGFLESNPWRSARPYPSQVYFGPSPTRSYCSRHYRSRHYRSYDPISGTFLAKDGMRHHC